MAPITGKVLGLYVQPGRSTVGVRLEGSDAPHVFDIGDGAAIVVDGVEVSPGFFWAWFTNRYRETITATLNIFFDVSTRTEFTSSKE